VRYKSTFYFLTYLPLLSIFVQISIESVIYAQTHKILCVTYSNGHKQQMRRRDIKYYWWRVSAACQSYHQSCHVSYRRSWRIQMHIAVMSVTPTHWSRFRRSYIIMAQGICDQFTAKFSVSVTVCEGVILINSGNIYRIQYKTWIVSKAAVIYY